MIEPNKSNEQEVTLSAALLAPLNSIFEAQIHAARAFLNFIMQMGFRHKYTLEEESAMRQALRELKSAGGETDRIDEIQDTLDGIDKQKKAEEWIKPLLDKMQRGEELTELQVHQVQEHLREYGDLYQQCVRYVDNTGKQRRIYIPNLALLPIQPLSIESAKFNFEMYVSDSSKQFDQMGTVKGLAEKHRPWYLINPKSVRGTITSDKMSESSKTIKIEMNIKTGNMPFGLNQLLTALTNSAEDVERKFNPNS